MKLEFVEVNNGGTCLLYTSDVYKRQALNIENIQILSGDKQSIVANFAEKLGISKAYWRS